MDVFAYVVGQLHRFISVRYQGEFYVLSLSVLHRACAACVARFGRDGPVPAPKHARMVPSWPKHVRVVRAGDLNPTTCLGSADFIPLGFRRLLREFVVWTIPSPFPARGLGAAHLVYTFPKISGLGSDCQ